MPPINGNSLSPFNPYMRQPNAVTPINIAAFTAIGDSLMPGRDNFDSGRDANDPEVPNAYQYVNESLESDFQQIRPDASPIWFPDTPPGVARISVMEPMLIEYEGLQSKSVAVIPTAVGGASMDHPSSNNDWNPITPGTHLVNAATAHNAGMAALGALGPTTCEGVIICLTTNDTNAGNYVSNTYRQMWLDLFSYIEANFNGVSATTPILIAGSVNTFGDAVVARSDMEDMAMQRTHTYVEHPIRPTDDPNNLHPTKEENRTWGAAIAQMLNHARLGTQPIPTITTNPSANSPVSESLSLALHHTGLDLASRYGVIEITGGPEAAEFEIGGTFLNPTLDQVTPGIVAGDYEVDLAVKNSAGQFGPNVRFTITKEVSETSPVASFGAGEIGAVWDLTSFSNLKQNIDGTGDITGFGQPVGWVEDLSPNDGHLVALGDDGTRPTIEQDANGHPYLQFSGGQMLVFPVFLESGSFECFGCYGIQGPSQLNAIPLGIYSTSSTTPFLHFPITRTTVAGQLELSGRNNSNSLLNPRPVLNGILDGGDPHVISAEIFGSNDELRLRDDNSAPQTTTMGTFSEAHTLHRSSMGARGQATPGLHFNGRVYSGAVIGRTASNDTERDDWIAWAASRCGVVLP